MNSSVLQAVERPSRPPPGGDGMRLSKNDVWREELLRCTYVIEILDLFCATVKGQLDTPALVKKRN